MLRRIAVRCFVPVLLVLSLASAACGDGSRDSEAAVEGLSSDTATWEVNPTEPPAVDTRQVAVLVTRLGCAGGETGNVLPPTVDENDTQIVVTFAVEPARGESTCPGNKPVMQNVTLDRPLGARTLVDGACLDGEAVSTGPCVEGAQRWPVQR